MHDLASSKTIGSWSGETRCPDVALVYVRDVVQVVQLDPTAAPMQVLFIRHGEKPGDDGAPHGINHQGEHDPHSLSVRGWMRAGALAGLMSHLPSPRHEQAGSPERVIATHPSESAKSRRELDTATPIARRLAIEVEGHLGHGKEDEVRDAILADPRTVLVVWHHGSLAHLVRGFPITNSEAVPHVWPPDRFDLIWLLTRGPHDLAYTFTSMNQRLLDGDLGTP